ncbi:4231_t:CDS:2 [Scutellospora calospora]|uniref:4231_t:CDS:1 n=1 Tax=Scutellospora calospora TaxID=85575 RepID=A0ACA9L955_9GLOM|nr:4231_t:CDS:2 [Scutellospora calospora]
MPDSPLLSTLLSSNPYFSAGVGVLGVGASLAILRQGLTRGMTLARRHLLVSLEIPSKDKSYAWFLHWMSKQSIRNAHQLAVETSFVQHDNGSVSAAFKLVPDNKMLDITTGSPWETVTLTTISRDRNIFTNLLHEAQELALAQQEGKTVIYTSWGPEWRPFGLPRKRRSLDSVILDKGVKERIVKDVKDFINNGNWYNERGYLLYGPPGSGKSSFIQALAGELEYNICILNLSEAGLTDDRLNHLLSNAPERSIMLLEDIDAAFMPKRETPGSSVTLSGLLNALDGVAASEERIIFMTTNYVDRLQQALIRPGRVDLKEHLDVASDYQIRTMFLRFYENETELAERFVEKIRGKGVSTAQLQGHFVFWKDDPRGAVQNADSVTQGW